MEGENYFSLKLQITCVEYKARNVLQGKKTHFQQYCVSVKTQIQEKAYMAASEQRYVLPKARLRNV